tara:strand:+ start:261 stop:1130 length:870 start_codon:yes stop_codon:yes gene_type:complete
MIKINKKNIKKSNNNIFGDWIKDDNLKNNYTYEPFGHIIIENFLNDDYIENVNNNFPTNINDNNWYKYNNPLEVKFANDNINELPDNIKNIFYSLSSEKVINKLKEITNINNLEYDPYCHGAGLHMHPVNGRLNMHLDYEKHPISNKQRRLNIILHLSKDWNKDWNGATELWNSDLTKCIVKSEVKFNSALIFETSNTSWHGLPDKIKCPDNIFRKSLAFYYVTDLENKSSNNKYGANNSGYRTKAAYNKKSYDKYDERLEKLFAIRKERRITDEDMKNIWPDWNNNDY